MELDRLKMTRIGGFDASSNCKYRSIILHLAPGLEVVSAEPDDVGELPVSLTDVATIVVRLLCTVALEDAQPTAGLDRVEEDDDPVLCCKTDHFVDAAEERRVRSSAVAGCLAGSYAVIGGGVCPITRVGRAEGVDPNRVEPGCSAVGEELLGVSDGEVDGHGLRRVAHDHERAVALVDEIPPS